MKTIRNILGGLFVAILALSGGNAAKAQETKETPATTTTVKAGKKLTPEELVVVLENLGFNPKPVENKEGTMVQINLEIAQSGWTLRPYITWSKDQSNYFLVATIVHTDGKTPISADMFQAMLALNYDFFPASLVCQTYSNGVVQVNLYMTIPNEAVTAAAIRTKVTAYCEMIRLACEARMKVEKAEAVAKAKAQAKADPSVPSVP